MEIDMATATSYLYMMDTDWVVTIEYKITSHGAAATYWDPAEDVEWDIEKIWISQDLGSKIIRPEFELTGAMFDLVADLAVVQDDIMQHINDSCDDDEPDYDDYREREYQRDDYSWAVD
jgi:hypothetical protein